MNRSKNITLNGNKYTIFFVKYREYNFPVVLNKEDFIEIRKMNKEWKYNNGFISSSHRYNDGYGNMVIKEIYLHEIVIGLKNKEYSETDYSEYSIDDSDSSLDDCDSKRPIIHLNRLGNDNRRDNLIYDIVDKEVKKNMVKKKRTIQLPRRSGIKVDNIPTYVWYMKPDKSHGERFVVKIDDIIWKTSSSPNLSLQYKLEEAKMYLRHLFRNNNDLYQKYSMNGDFNNKGKKLLSEYYDIVEKLGYKKFKRVIPSKNTTNLLKPHYDGLNKVELGLLKRKRENLISDN